MGKYSNQVKTNEAWLPMIPSQWELKKIKWSFKERSEKGYPDDPLLVASQNMGVVPKNVYGKRTVEALKDLDKLKLVKVGDYVVSLRSFQGGIEYAYYQGIISPAYTIMRPNPDFCSAYYKFLFKSAPFIKLLTTCVTGIREGQNIDYGKLKNHYIPVPPRAEQDQIVRFLDWKVSEINKLIGIRRKEIQELNQAKESIITRAVTHGIKKRVKYKTNDKYYKELPIGWHITKTRHVLLQPLTDGPHTTPTFFEDGIPFVSAEAVSCGNGRIDFEHIRGFISQDFYEECCKKYIPQIDDIYMIKSGATTGRVAIVDTDKIFTIWSPLAVFRCNPRVITARFLFYALQANPYQQQVQDGWSYGTQQNIGMRVLERLKIAYPDIVEQNEISSYLDSKCNLFERLIQLTRNKIKGLLELKNTIISDVVTGKIDVRNIPVPDYEHVGDSANDGEGNDEETGIPGEED